MLEVWKVIGLIAAVLVSVLAIIVIGEICINWIISLLRRLIWWISSILG